RTVATRVSSMSRSILGMSTFREPCSPLHQGEEQPDTKYIPRIDLDTQETRETHNLYNVFNVKIITLFSDTCFIPKLFQFLNLDQ
ncbi:hypothetical protein ALC56_07770, partial [Trachymyrmex septentrionalis]